MHIVLTRDTGLRDFLTMTIDHDYDYDRFHGNAEISAFGRSGHCHSHKS